MQGVRLFWDLMGFPWGLQTGLGPAAQKRSGERWGVVALLRCKMGRRNGGLSPMGSFGFEMPDS